MSDTAIDAAPTDPGPPFPPVDTLSFSELLEAVAVNSDLATHVNDKRHLPSVDETTDEQLRERATRYYDRRNACMAELRRRNESAPTGDGMTAGEVEAMEGVLHMVDLVAYGGEELIYVGPEGKEAIEIVRALVERSRP